MLPLPNEGDEGVEEREGRREGRKYVCVFIEDNCRSCPLLLPEAGTALVAWGGEYCCKSARLLPLTLVLQPPLQKFTVLRLFLLASSLSSLDLSDPHFSAEPGRELGSR